jgi:uncharacterized protein (TIGR00369 family)
MDDPRKLIAGWLDGTREPPPAGRLVGFRVTAFENGALRTEMDAGPEHHNPMGTVHGGILCDLADAAMGTAFAATLGEGESFTTLELSARYFHAVRSGHLVAEARVVQRGRNVGFVEADVTDGEGRTIARFASTCVVLLR